MRVEKVQIIIIKIIFYKNGIWRVLSMVFYLSNQFTNHILLGIILKKYLSFFIEHKFFS